MTASTHDTAARTGFRTRNAAVGIALFALSTAWAVDIRYGAVDLTDTVPGADLWQVDYYVTGPLGAFQSLNLLFPAASYSQLMVLSTPVPLWVAPLDPVLGLDGQATITATEALAANYQGLVSMTAVWSGAGAPAGQTYEVLSDSLNVIDTRMTTPVPEPSAAWLLLAGAGVIGASAARRRRRVIR